MDDLEAIHNEVKEMRDEVREMRAQVASLQQFRWMFLGGIGVIIALFVPLIVDLFTNI